MIRRVPARMSMSGDTMQDAARALSVATTIAAAPVVTTSRASFIERTLKLRGRIRFGRPALTPIETMVDWFEATYGGPLARKPR